MRFTNKGFGDMAEAMKADQERRRIEALKSKAAADQTAGKIETNAEVEKAWTDHVKAGGD